MLIKCDTHLHTTLSVHAVGSVAEYAARAAALGLEAIAVTDHCSLKMCHYEQSVDVILADTYPEKLYGVRIYKGAEIDLEDYQGHMCFYNVPYDAQSSALDRLLATRDIVIASPHFPPEGRVGSYEEITRMYLGAVANPCVTTIGHPERINGDYDITAVALAAAQNGTFLEVNSASIPRGYGPAISKMLTVCKSLGTMVVVNSDSHVVENLGQVDEAKRLLIDCAFPPELVANRDLASFEAALAEQKRRKRP